MFMVNDPEYIDPAFAIPTSIVLFVLFIMIVLVQNRRATVKRRAQDRIRQNIKRRETFIQAELERDPIPNFIEGLNNESSAERS